MSYAIPVIASCALKHLMHCAEIGSSSEASSSQSNH
jgi:hypothetical protein